MFLARVQSRGHCVLLNCHFRGQTMSGCVLLVMLSLITKPLSIFSFVISRWCVEWSHGHRINWISSSPNSLSNHWWGLPEWSTTMGVAKGWVFILLFLSHLSHFFCCSHCPSLCSRSTLGQLLNPVYTITCIFAYFLLSGTRHSRLKLYIFRPRPQIDHAFRSPGSLKWVICRKQELRARGAYCCRGVLASMPDKEQNQEIH